MTLSINSNDVSDTNRGLAEDLAQAMQTNGFTAIRIPRNDEEGVTVDGRIGVNGKVSIRLIWREEKQYLVLKDGYKQTQLLWKNIEVSDLPEIISIVKDVALSKEASPNTPLPSLPIPPSRKRWMMPLVITIATLIGFGSGMYVIQEVRTHCLSTQAK